MQTWQEAFCDCNACLRCLCTNKGSLSFRWTCFDRFAVILVGLRFALVVDGIRGCVEVGPSMGRPTLKVKGKRERLCKQAYSWYSLQAPWLSQLVIPNAQCACGYALQAFSSPFPPHFGLLSPRHFSSSYPRARALLASFLPECIVLCAMRLHY